MRAHGIAAGTTLAQDFGADQWERADGLNCAVAVKHKRWFDFSVQA